jgi:mRNA interferase RelE/StbE
MEVKFSKPFEKDLKAIDERKIVLKVDEIIITLNNAASLTGIENLKKIKGHKNCYRIRIGDYRLGIFVSGKTVWLARLMHRREIYRYFP